MRRNEAAGVSRQAAEGLTEKQCKAGSAMVAGAGVPFLRQQDSEQEAEDWEGAGEGWKSMDGGSTDREPHQARRGYAQTGVWAGNREESSSEQRARR